MLGLRKLPAIGLPARTAGWTLALALTAALPATADPAVVAQAGGEPGDVVVAGDVAYVAHGPAVAVWQLDPDGIAPPALVATTTPLPGLVKGLAVAGDHLFAVWRTDWPSGKLAVYSLADPLAPAHLLDFAYSASEFLSPGGLLLLGSQLLIADAEAGLVSIDVSDPTAPVVDTTLSGSLGIQRLARVGGDGVVAWGRNFLGMMFLETFDATDPSAPTSVGFYSAANYFDAAVFGTRAILVGFGMEVVDLSDPANPAFLGGDGSVVGRTALWRGRYAYIGDEAGLHVWDLLDPANPVAGAVVPAPADRHVRSALHAAADGPEALLLTDTGRALLFDLSVPSLPELEHAVDLPVGTDTTAVRDTGGLLFFADFYSGLRISQPADFASVGRFDPGIFQGGYEDVDVDSGVAHLASWGYGLLLYDVTDPSQPAALGDVPFGYASAVDAEGDWAYLVKSTEGGLFAVVDVSDPTQPAIVQTLPLSKGLDVLYHQGLALVADEQAFDFGGMRIFDVSVPASPVQLALYNDCPSAGGVAASGTLAAVACHDGTLHLVDLTVPTLPVQLGVWSDPERFLTGHRVAIDGDRVWFAHSDGVDLVDVSDPAAPRRLALADLANASRGIDLAADGSAWITTGIGGVYRVDLVLFEDGFESGGTGAWSATQP
jgi:hypothetical protein